MAINKFKPESPERHFLKASDMTLARFGHLNRLVDDINTELQAVESSALTPAADVADATDEADAVVKLNDLLASLRTAGILA